MKHILLVLIGLVSLAVPAFCWPTVYPTGTTLYNPERAYNGYTLFTPLDEGAGGDVFTIYLINMNGEPVHQWSVPFAPLYSRLLPNGNLVVIGRHDKAEAGRPGLGKYEIGGVAGWLVELTWEGRRPFKHVDLKMHHDFVRLPNGHYLYLAWEKVPIALQKKVRGGIKGSEFKDGTMFNDMLVEIDGQGKVVWRWHANDHLNPAIDIIGPLHKREEWVHANSVAVLKNGNILLTSRSLDSMLVVDKRSGNIIWRWGSTAYLDKTTGRLEIRTGSNTLGGPHGAEQIATSMPGAGHILCYDNGMYSDASRAVEVDFVTRKLVWQSSQPGIGRKHFSNFLSNAQRLPNGNTLICDGANGRFFQVTKENQTVWEYINPYTTSPQYQGAVFRAYQYSPEYCPQFKTLPPARGAAVVPPPNSLLRMPPAR